MAAKTCTPQILNCTGCTMGVPFATLEDAQEAACSLLYSEEGRARCLGTVIMDDVTGLVVKANLRDNEESSVFSWEEN